MRVGLVARGCEAPTPTPTRPGDMLRLAELSSFMPDPPAGPARGMAPGMAGVLFVLPLLKPPPPSELDGVPVPEPVGGEPDSPAAAGEGDACGMASGVGISLPYSFCLPALARA